MQYGKFSMFHAASAAEFSSLMMIASASRRRLPGLITEAAVAIEVRVASIVEALVDTVAINALVFFVVPWILSSAEHFFFV